jgi:hypothetical protein
MSSTFHSTQSYVFSSVHNMHLNIAGHNIPRNRAFRSPQRSGPCFRSVPEGNANAAFDIVFGKPSAPKDLYETIARDSSKIGVTDDRFISSFEFRACPASFRC